MASLKLPLGFMLAVGVGYVFAFPFVPKQVWANVAFVVVGCIGLVGFLVFRRKEGES